METLNENKGKLEILKQKVKQFSVGFSKVAIIVVALATGFTASSLYTKYSNSIKSSGMQKTHTHNETSVAMNERGEVMILNRKNGTYQIFSDSVGKMIFDLYASKMYYESTRK